MTSQKDISSFFLPCQNLLYKFLNDLTKRYKRREREERRMAKLFNKQAKLYVGCRPTYPSDLFQFIASKTPHHHLAWDAGTGNGQAAAELAKNYKNVIATDTSAQQISLAIQLPNIRYQVTPPTISLPRLARDVAPQASVDLVTVAQALHWFDLPSFYRQVKWVLCRPHGVLAVWFYTIPEVDPLVDAVYRRLYADSAPFWDQARKMVDDEFRGLEFPFEPVPGTHHTGPFRFEATRSMDLEEYFMYIRSWSAYQTARERGVELLKKEVMEDLECAWGGDRGEAKVVRFPIQLRIGRVGN